MKRLSSSLFSTAYIPCSMSVVRNYLGKIPHRRCRRFFISIFPLFTQTLSEGNTCGYECLLRKSTVTLHSECTLEPGWQLCYNLAGLLEDVVWFCTRFGIETIRINAVMVYCIFSCLKLSACFLCTLVDLHLNTTPPNFRMSATRFVGEYIFFAGFFNSILSNIRKRKITIKKGEGNASRDQKFDKHLTELSLRGVTFLVFCQLLEFFLIIIKWVWFDCT